MGTMYLVPLLCAAAFLAAVAAFCWFTRPRGEHAAPRRETRLERLADPAPMPGELIPFPADTGPLIIASDLRAAEDGLEREVQHMIAAAERHLGKLA